MPRESVHSRGVYLWEQCSVCMWLGPLLSVHLHEVSISESLTILHPREHLKTTTFSQTNSIKEPHLRCDILKQLVPEQKFLTLIKPSPHVNSASILLYPICKSLDYLLLITHC